MFFQLFVLCLFSCFVCFDFYFGFSLFFILFCVLFLPMYTVDYFIFVYNINYNWRRVEIKLHLINNIWYSECVSVLCSYILVAEC